MTIEKIPLIAGLNDTPATDANGQNGAVVIAKVNELVDTSNSIFEQLNTIPSFPDAIFLPEENSQFAINGDYLNKVIFWGCYGGIKLAFFNDNLEAKKVLFGNLPAITIINTTSFSIPLINEGNISLSFCPDDPSVGPNSQALRSKGKLTIYFQDSENAYVVGSIINVAGY